MTKRHKPIPDHHIKPHHKNPYRAHHITIAGLSIFLLIVSAVFIIIFFTSRQGELPPPDTSSPAQVARNSNVLLSSTAGHNISADLDAFNVFVRQTNEGDHTEITDPDDITNPTPLTSIIFEPKSGTTSSDARASSLAIEYGEVSTDTSEITARNQLNATDAGSYELITEETEELASNSFDKFIFRYESSRENTVAPIYSIVWVSTVNDYTYTVSLKGLIGSSAIPSAYGQVLDSFQFGQTLAAQFFRQTSGSWINQSSSTNQYLSDLISPAVTKIYHIVCGSISFEFQTVSDQQCRAVTGSGFLISNDGYMATNGHVVVYEPEDALVDVLLANPLELSSFLTNVVGLSPGQITSLQSQPEELASIVAKIYDLPSDAITFRDKREVILASIGASPVQPETEEDILGLFSFRDTNDVKKAELVDFSYSGKDQLNLFSGSPEGFTQSDVALLKVSLDNAPIVHLASASDVTPGQEVTLLGFPNDAENQLVDTSELVVSITNGTISSIRTAAGGEGRLFQTDSDASQGNSGGPAISREGRALGLLTYRFKDSTTQNAAKSYVRDIEDIRQLLRQQDVVLNVNSPLQQAWSNGLRYYSQSRFRDALHEFNIVANLYPSHRLVDNYIDASEANIAQGLDRSGSPIAFYVGLVVGGGMLALSLQLIFHHRRHHHAYHALQNKPAKPDIQPTEEATQSDTA